MNLLGLYLDGPVTLSCEVPLITHHTVDSVRYCINSFVNHVGDSELRGVGVRALEILQIFTSVTLPLPRPGFYKQRQTQGYGSTL